MIVSGIGRLVADPEQQGNGPVKFRLASDRYNPSTKQREGQFFSCHAWGKTGELAQKYLGKGSQIFISGDLINREFQGTNGDKVRVTEIDVRTLEFISGGKKPQQQSEEPSQGGW